MSMKKLIAAGVAAVLLVTLSGCGIKYEGALTNCTVTDKYVSTSDGESDKFIATSCGVFTVEDEFTEGQFNSADLYASIRVDHTYDFKANGFRNGFFSGFPNVYEATEVGELDDEG